MPKTGMELASLLLGLILGAVGMFLFLFRSELMQLRKASKTLKSGKYDNLINSASSFLENLGKTEEKEDSPPPLQKTTEDPFDQPIDSKAERKYKKKKTGNALDKLLSQLSEAMQDIDVSEVINAFSSKKANVPTQEAPTSPVE